MFEDWALSEKCLIHPPLTATSLNSKWRFSATAFKSELIIHSQMFYGQFYRIYLWCLPPSVMWATCFYHMHVRWLALIRLLRITLHKQGWKRTKTGELSSSCKRHSCTRWLTRSSCTTRWTTFNIATGSIRRYSGDVSAVGMKLHRNVAKSVSGYICLDDMDVDKLFE